MYAEDIMVTDVVTANPEMDARAAALLLVDHRISGAPVVDKAGALVGIISEGDLLRRSEIGTEKRRSGWLSIFASDEAAISDFIKSHGRKVRDLMTRQVISAAPDTPLADIATLMEKHGVKRIPIVDGGKIVGLVSRSNLVQAFARRLSAASAGANASDRVLRARVLNGLREVPGTRVWQINPIVENGVVDLWGPVGSETQRKALLVAAEATTGIKEVRDHLYALPLTSE